MIRLNFKEDASIQISLKWNGFHVLLITCKKKTNFPTIYRYFSDKATVYSELFLREKILKYKLESNHSMYSTIRKFQVKSVFTMFFIAISNVISFIISN